VSWVALFPLEVVLFPGGDLRLHIFEPRYRAMLEGCIRDASPFIVIRQQDGEMAEIGCLATVVRILKRYSDGRFDLLARGTERIKLGEVREHASGYIEGEVETLAEIPEQGDYDLEDRLDEQFRKLATITGEHGIDPPPRGPRWSFRLADSIRMSADQRQELLDQRSESGRLRRIEKQIRIRIAVIAERERVQGVIRGNGRLRGGHAPDAPGGSTEGKK